MYPHKNWLLARLRLRAAPAAWRLAHTVTESPPGGRCLLRDVDCVAAHTERLQPLLTGVVTSMKQLGCYKVRGACNNPYNHVVTHSLGVGSGTPSLGIRHKGACVRVYTISNCFTEYTAYCILPPGYV